MRETDSDGNLPRGNRFSGGKIRRRIKLSWRENRKFKRPHLDEK